MREPFPDTIYISQTEVPCEKRETNKDEQKNTEAGRNEND